MRWYVILILILVALWILGYLMGPSPGGRAITRRDQRMVTSRSTASDGLSMREAREALGAIEIAKGIVTRARTLVDVQDLDPESALAVGYTSAVRKLPRSLDGQRHVAFQLAMATNALAKYGVLNKRSEQAVRSSGIDPMEFITAPERIIAFYGVRDLAAWPTE